MGLERRKLRGEDVFQRLSALAIPGVIQGVPAGTPNLLVFNGFPFPPQVPVP